MGKRRAKTKSSRNKDKDKKFESKKQRNLLIVGGFLVFLMIFSAFGVILYNDSYGGENAIEIAGFSFSTKQEDNMFFWEVVKTPSTRSQFKGIRFYSSPEDAYFVDSNNAEDILSASDGIYFSLDPRAMIQENVNLSDQSDFTQEQISAIQAFQYQNLAYMTLSEVFDISEIFSIQTMSKNFTGIDFPIITCADASENVAVVEFEHTIDFSREIIVEDNCVRIIANNPIDFIRLSEGIKISKMIKND